jgi:hypothetical protein
MEENLFKRSPPLRSKDFEGIMAEKLCEGSSLLLSKDFEGIPRKSFGGWKNITGIYLHKLLNEFSPYFYRFQFLIIQLHFYCFPVAKPFLYKLKYLLLLDLLLLLLAFATIFLFIFLISILAKFPN